MNKNLIMLSYVNNNNNNNVINIMDRTTISISGNLMVLCHFILLASFALVVLVPLLLLQFFIFYLVHYA